MYIYIYVDIYIYNIYAYMCGGLSTSSHSYGSACQQKVLETFTGPGYLHSEDGVVSISC